MERSLGLNEAPGWPDHSTHVQERHNDEAPSGGLTREGAEKSLKERGPRDVATGEAGFAQLARNVDGRGVSQDWPAGSITTAGSMRTSAAVELVPVLSLASQPKC